MKEKFVNVYNGVKGKVEKHSPEILMGVGVVGVVTGTVMACRATLKLNDILEEARLWVCWTSTALWQTRSSIPSRPVSAFDSHTYRRK